MENKMEWFVHIVITERKVPRFRGVFARIETSA